MTERTGLITFQDNPLTLLGDPVKVGDQAPDCTLITNDLQEFSLASTRPKVVLISVVPSLDTPVCNQQTRRFNQAAASLGEDVTVLTISMDLPFAQARWCGAEGIERVMTLSDHRDACFGRCYGMLVKELRLLARGVFVIDRQGVIRYIELVNELTHEPRYDDALDAVKKLI